MMIKRAGNIVIMLLLLTATGGIPITRHYCGSAEMSFAVYSTPKSCCNGHCDKCHNIFKFSKVNDAFEAGSSIYATATFSEIVSQQASDYVALFDNSYTSPLTGTLNQRKILTDRAGHSPASFGNFRC